MEPVKNVQHSCTRKKVPQRSRRYGADFKLEGVKKFLEERSLFLLSARNAGLAFEKMNKKRELPPVSISTRSSVEMPTMISAQNILRKQMVQFWRLL